MEKIFQDILSMSTDIAIKIVASIVILIVGTKLIKWLINKMGKNKYAKKIDTSLFSFLSSLAKIVLYVVLVITIASIMGVPMASFVTLLASAGVAIGLALQGALSNLAGGVMLLLFRPFKVGDYIKSDDGEGIVREITVFYTIIMTFDNKKITIPNGSLTGSAITNYSDAEFRRVDLNFTVSHNSDIELVKQLMLAAANSHSLALKDPQEPFARLSTINDNSLVFTLRVWCKNSDYWSLYHDLQEDIKKAFVANNIDVPGSVLELKK
ncbi:MAG: mechanosensitive ion channel [Clostridia bacterium]|nr:mechanosensitive ion channel [Clostridia bacterium]